MQTVHKLHRIANHRTIVGHILRNNCANTDNNIFSDNDIITPVEENKSSA